jgi:cob(I)alamin adenosyltransferase
MSLYTKTGDHGKSAVNNRKQLDKSSVVFDVLGTLDELSTTLGFLHLSTISDVKNIVINIQNDLLIIGSVVAGRAFTVDLKKSCEKKVTDFERLINIFTAKLPVLKTFILPGGCIESSYLHLSRVVCRRLERVFVRFIRESGRKDLGIVEKYFNRLSDLLYVMARYSNKKRKFKDIIWKALK